MARRGGGGEQPVVGVSRKCSYSKNLKQFCLKTATVSRVEMNNSKGKGKEKKRCLQVAVFFSLKNPTLARAVLTNSDP